MHTPTPWHVNELMRFGNHINSERGQVGVTLSIDDAAFIVTACNAHDALVAALTDLYDVVGNTGLYANFKIQMDAARAALALATPKEAVR